MYRFTIQIAGVPIEIRTGIAAFESRFKAYLTDKKPEFSVSVTEADLEFERASAKAQEPQDWQLEWMAIYRKICSVMAGKNTVLIHGSSLCMDGKAYLFCAKSGTGKSTHTKLWRQVFGDRVVMINDDKPLVSISGNEAVIYGTPWNGKHHIGTNISAPLKNIVFLERGSENELVPFDKKNAFTELLKYIYRPDDTSEMLQVLDTAAKIADLSSFWTLRCNMDPSAAQIAYKAMSEPQKG